MDSAILRSAPSRSRLLCSTLSVLFLTLSWLLFSGAVARAAPREDACPPPRGCVNVGPAANDPPATKEPAKNAKKAPALSPPAHDPPSAVHNPHAKKEP